MNRRTPDRDLERLLENDRGEFGAIYDRLARAEPPRRLDRAILAEASRAAVGARAPRTQRWLVGLGSAAGLVLAAGIAWQVGREIETTQPDHAAGSAAEGRPRAVVPVQPLGPSTESTDPPPPPAVAPPGLTEAREREASHRKSDRGRSQERAEAAKRTIAKPQPAPAAPAPAAIADAEMAPANPAPEPEAAKVAAPAAGAGSPSGDGLSSRRALDAAAGSAQPTTSGAGTASPRDRISVTPSSSMQLRSNMQLAPAAWVAEIRRLADAGLRQQAIENIRLFRRMHPDWHLDDDLRRLDE